ncbi:MBL fold metallo-hydrolase [Bacillus weihaiensis]|uniref:MBL fold metallo-hydrolase n=1 Tax=Bacillus weihaiensis TaxID=1547283 RepID=A0A1L3MQ93_9BACI|nr:MBL fold metallo-hydrolase [Bacillus weihaiensis]APH04511.1 MBL fold metallo-hydrolase [Bacillus weihaiensis]
MNESVKSNHIMKMNLPTPFPVGDVNVYLIKNDTLTLVDAGPKTEEAWEAFQFQLKEFGYTLNDIDQIIITHHHPDHVGLLDFFQAEIPILGHAYNKPWLEKNREFMNRMHLFFERLFASFGVSSNFIPTLQRVNNSLDYSCTRHLDQFLLHGDKISGLHQWEVLETPGHAQSHIVLYEKNTGILLGGDLLLKQISPNPLLEPPMISEHTNRPKPQLQLNQSISRLLDLPLSLVYPGHGENIMNAHELITYRLNQQHKRAEQVRDFISKKPVTAFEICQNLFPTIYYKQLMLTMSETVGQLDYLEEIGQIRVDDTNERHLYYTT